MAYVSARYIKAPDEKFVEVTDRFAIAVDDFGVEWSVDVPNCQTGDWLRYIDGGGTVEPYVEAGDGV